MSRSTAITNRNIAPNASILTKFKTEGVFALLEDISNKIFASSVPNEMDVWNVGTTITARNVARGITSRFQDASN